jgi:hypothetical protein
MRTQLTNLTEWLRRRRAAGRRHPYWPVLEPVVPSLRDWPVARPRR